MPSPVDALPCGSRSMMRTSSPIAAKAVPRLIAVVVLPTPPFWLASAITRGDFGRLMVNRSLRAPAELADLQDHPARADSTVMFYQIEDPRLSSLVHLTHKILSLVKGGRDAALHQGGGQAQQVC